MSFLTSNTRCTLKDASTKTKFNKWSIISIKILSAREHFKMEILLLLGNKMHNKFHIFKFKINRKRIGTRLRVGSKTIITAIIRTNNTLGLAQVIHMAKNRNGLKVSLLLMLIIQRISMIFMAKKMINMLAINQNILIISTKKLICLKIKIIKINHFTLISLLLNKWIANFLKFSLFLFLLLKSKIQALHY